MTAFDIDNFDHFSYFDSCSCLRKFLAVLSVPTVLVVLAVLSRFDTFSALMVCCVLNFFLFSLILTGVAKVQMFGFHRGDKINDSGIRWQQLSATTVKLFQKI